MNKTLEVLRRNGHNIVQNLKTTQFAGVQLGPEARTALYTTKVDNGELPSVVEELQAWESAGLSPTEEIVRQFARVYALEGNSKGVV